MKRQAEDTPVHLPSTALQSRLLKGQAVFDTGRDALPLRIQFISMVRRLHPDKFSGGTQAFKLFMREYNTLNKQQQKMRRLSHDATRASADRERRLAAKEHAAAQMAQARANPQFRQPRPAGGEPVAAQSKPVGSSGPPGAVSSDVHRILSGARTYHFETNIVLEPEKLLIQQGCCRRLLNSQTYGMIEDRRRSDEVDLFIACGAMNMLTITDRINRTACKYNWRRSKNFLHLDWISSGRIEAPGN